MQSHVNSVDQISNETKTSYSIKGYSLLSVIILLSSIPLSGVAVIVIEGSFNVVVIFAGGNTDAAAAVAGGSTNVVVIFVEGRSDAAAIVAGGSTDVAFIVEGGRSDAVAIVAGFIMDVVVIFADGRSDVVVTVAEDSVGNSAKN